MNYLHDFQKKELILPIIDRLHKKVKKPYRFMEFCGGHTHALFKYGLMDLLPKEIQMVHGPGCPVCVLPAHPIKNIIKLCEQNSDILLTTYSDMMRVPTDEGDSLSKAKSRGLAIKGVYAADDALETAKKNPDKKVIFLAIGFETTIPATALVLQNAKKENISNFYVYCNHLNTAKALEAILSSDIALDGLIGPGHVALVLGSDFFKPYAQRLPIVISGFSAYDLVSSLEILLDQKEGVTNQYKRAVTDSGNLHCQEAMKDCFELRDQFEWRGLGEIKESAFKLTDRYASFDAEKVFHLNQVKSFDHPACLCSEVLFGEKNPLDCKLFSKVCTPKSPYGPCMVSSEGACSAYYGRSR